MLSSLLNIVTGNSARTSEGLGLIRTNEATVNDMSKGTTDWERGGWLLSAPQGRACPAPVHSKGSKKRCWDSCSEVPTKSCTCPWRTSMKLTRRMSFLHKPLILKTVFAVSRVLQNAQLHGGNRFTKLLLRSARTLYQQLFILLISEKLCFSYKNKNPLILDFIIINLLL